VRILFCSHQFAPAIGGTETVGKLLAAEFSALGHDVRVVTETPETFAANYPIERRASARELLGLARQADVIFHSNISLRYAWPVLLARKPWVVLHHTWLDRAHGSSAATVWLKRNSIRFAQNIAISRAMAAALPRGTVVIPNPYDSEAFHLKRGIDRARDLIFVGRLVSDKGADILISACEKLAQTGARPTVTIVGDGPERATLELKARASGAAIEFAGVKTGGALAELLNTHRIMVVPSRWHEPFGVVALEGIACGCVVVGTAGGGLPEAIGPCGSAVPNGDAAALAAELRRLLDHPAELARYRAGAEAHLKKHEPSVVAARYLEVFETARRERTS
jgi:glycogen synthase